MIETAMALAGVGAFVSLAVIWGQRRARRRADHDLLVDRLEAITRL